ncbi:amino acid ABC transporter substrate-binding protein [Ligilactobacillus salitolerans]|uniref:Amino acid ABC transporter substrate-binding protein n=1 Tax=Ligilactobacillus salitolerans TaxID=1808352 RepID=A0A401IS76_9LACO|nr:transporter substrate-binding domain-containing protein [Ligilactobacillus salitolerans]GBG94367.1 amino acid ABC transporter substrate-binding protein [Ligilactobacillus salitolerans]
MSSKRHKIIYLGLALTLLLGLIIGGKLSAQANQTLKIGMLAHDQPLSYQSKQKVRGANAVLARALGQQLDRPVTIVPVQTKRQLQNKLREGQLDLALGAFTQTKHFQQTKPVFYVRNMLFRRGDNKKRSVEKLAGHSVGMLKNGSQAELLAQLEVKAKRYRTLPDLVQALKQKKISAAVVTEPQYTKYLQKHPELVSAKDPADEIQTAQILHRISGPEVTAQKVLGLTYKDKHLLRQVEHALNQLRQAGSLTQISLKYFKKDISQE